MAYEIHIRRLDAEGNSLPISLDEWHAAIDAVASVRRASGDTIIQNPTTGEVIGIRNSGGDAEVFDQMQQSWNRSLYWTRAGEISFRAPDGFDEPNHHLRKVVHDLAHALGAITMGDDGETYS